MNRLSGAIRKWAFPVAAAGGALLVAVSFLYIFSPGNAGWLRVETPSRAYRDQPFQVRVTLKTPEAGTYLGVDLHWMTEEKESHGYLTGIKAVQVIDGKAVYDLSIPVKASDQAAFLFAVVFLTRDGRWRTRFDVAVADPVPVQNWKEGDVMGPLAPRKAWDAMERRTRRAAESVPLRFLVAGIWLAVAAVNVAGRRHALWLSAAALVSSAWEALDVGTAAGNLLRAFVQHAGAYEERRGPQEVLTVMVLIAAVAAVVYLLSPARRSKKTTPWIFLTAFWGISLVHIFSFHGIDTLLSLSVAGLGAGQLARLAASLACLAVLIRRADLDNLNRA